MHKDEWSPPWDVCARGMKFFKSTMKNEEREGWSPSKLKNNEEMFWWSPLAMRKESPKVCPAIKYWSLNKELILESFEIWKDKEFILESFQNSEKEKIEFDSWTQTENRNFLKELNSN